jgi:histone-lysine N-methyltransferase SETMAR
MGVFFRTQTKILSSNLGHKNDVRPSIAIRIRAVSKVLYVIFFNNKGPVVQIPVPKGRTVTGKYYTDDVPSKLKKHYKHRRPQTGLK